jgi:hypothetical protein
VQISDVSWLDAAVPVALFEVINAAPAKAVSAFRGAALQSANLTEWQNSSSAVLLSVGPAGHLTFGDGVNIVTNTTTGSKFGTANTQKIGFWGATPVIQDTGWAITNKTTDRLGTLIDVLKTKGVLGA